MKIIKNEMQSTMMNMNSESYDSIRLATTMNRHHTRDDFIRGSIMSRSGAPGDLHPSEINKNKMIPWK